MKIKPIIIINGEPNSIFLEIFFKTLKTKKVKTPIILIASYNLLKLQMKKLKFNKRIKLLDIKKLKSYKLNNKSINLIHVKYATNNKAFEKISKKSKSYINDCFKVSIKLIKSGYTNKLINGPISKKNFLNKKFPGITEYLANEFNIRSVAMLIYNKTLSVSTITTHLPIKNVSKNINKKSIVEKANLINKFYKKFIGIKPRIGVTGLNPHCESADKSNEDKKILKPTIRKLSKMGLKISGPFAADTIFLKNNRKKFNLIIGMYHDQVLTPIKTLFEYDAINITIGLPFIRVSPDHGPNESMLGKNKSNYLSLLNSIKFLDF